MFRKISLFVRNFGVIIYLLEDGFPCSIYGLETVVSVLFTNTRTRWPHNEREILNTARGEAECSIENFEFIVLPARVRIFVNKTRTNSL